MHTDNILRLPFTRDLTEAGITYAIRSLSRSLTRVEASLYTRLRRIVSEAAVELAFRHFLTENKIPFRVKTVTAFTDPDRYDVSLGGHRCVLNSFLISNRDQIRKIQQDPGILLEAPALIPLDQDAGEGRHDEDLYLFAFATGLVSSSHADLMKILEAGKPVHLIHALPSSWANPKTWIPLGQLSLKHDSDAPLTLELNGQTEDREFIGESLLLPPHTRIESQIPFYSVSSIHVGRPIRGRVGIHSSTRAETLIIQSHEWGNLWVYGIDIHLVGWISRREFRQRANLIQPGTRVFQINRTRVKNLALPVSELHPMDVLFEKVGTHNNKNEP